MNVLTHKMSKKIAHPLFYKKFVLKCRKSHCYWLYQWH